MPLSPSEVRVLEEFVGTIESSLVQNQIANGFRAVRDAYITRVIIEHCVSHDLNLMPPILDWEYSRNALYRLIAAERDRI